jgi:uncharacterized membrane-anchored protein
MVAFGSYSKKEIDDEIEETKKTNQEYSRKCRKDLEGNGKEDWEHHRRHNGCHKHE